MVDDAMAGDRMIGMIQTRGGAAGGGPGCPIGCVGRITSFAETSDGRYLITLTGVCRFQVGEELEGCTPYRQARRLRQLRRDLGRTEEDPGLRPRAAS